METTIFGYDVKCILPTNLSKNSKSLLSVLIYGLTQNIFIEKC